MYCMHTELGTVAEVVGEATINKFSTRKMDADQDGVGRWGLQPRMAAHV